ncbi:DEAD/DEAH box helicase family protein [Flavobacterium sp. CS20]|uniref:DEAD/DEAH box helicase family protein n=1 Tax=Flavobacterium sp. CS20 TaxID=2775246 RepID=UPI001B3A120E|nr:DEAD/DEAH box helicase family protein [Flavobacterium sp. CS20]QTY26349.1 DEAD/DEAH box helicase family protein [Flavobacterium sp. CS20]
MSFRAITFPDSYTYSSDSEHIPLEFYNAVFPVSKTVDLFLGYFNSGAFRVLSESFAEFIYNGGSMRMITNHYYTKLDFENLIAESELNDYGEVSKLVKDLRKLKDSLDEYGQHFFDCLKYLIKENRLQIQPVSFGKQSLSHSKRMLFYDGENHILAEGSMNFTLAGFVKNAESFQVEVPWNSKVSQVRIENQRKHFEKVFNQENNEYTYLNPEEIKEAIEDIGEQKSIKDLLETSINIGSENYSKKLKEIHQAKKKKFEAVIDKLDCEPKFPFDEPRDYQKQAYKNWVENDYKGVFAMATGTGKTITSLNCVLQEYQKDKKYHSIILVPSIALLNQWEQEVLDFNFKNILKVGGGNKWENELANFASNLSWGISKNLIIISTYGSFVTDRFQKYFKKIQDKFTLIADEAHNMGASQIKKRLGNVSVEKKIGLSATPKRVYDPEGTDAIDAFFEDKPPYIYSFTMERALKEERLTEYKYYPKIVELQNDELESYIEISQRLLRFFDFDKGEFKKDPMVEKLLLTRKNIIHKAHNKIDCFKDIVKELDKKKKLKYVFTYVPEGFVYNDSGGSERLLNDFMRKAMEARPDLKINSYTAEDEDLNEILKGFSEGKIEMLFAMKMLDEGVDVPRAEVGIFASSTGNPRQFIQRRGSLLRKHKNKANAIIYDMIVVPPLNDANADTYRMERNQVKTELQRVAHFSSLSMNFYDTKNELSSICDKYELNIDQIIQEL